MDQDFRRSYGFAKKLRISRLATRRQNYLISYILHLKYAAKLRLMLIRSVAQTNNFTYLVKRVH